MRFYEKRGERGERREKGRGNSAALPLSTGKKEKKRFCFFFFSSPSTSSPSFVAPRHRCSPFDRKKRSLSPFDDGASHQTLQDANGRAISCLSCASTRERGKVVLSKRETKRWARKNEKKNDEKKKRKPLFFNSPLLFFAFSFSFCLSFSFSSKSPCERLLRGPKKGSHRQGRASGPGPKKEKEAKKGREKRNQQRRRCLSLFSSLFKRNAGKPASRGESPHFFLFFRSRVLFATFARPLKKERGKNERGSKGEREVIRKRKQRKNSPPSKRRRQTQRSSGGSSSKRKEEKQK